MKIVSSVEKYTNRLFTVSEDHAVEPGGFEIKRSIVHHRGSAVMMPVDDRKRVLLVRRQTVVQKIDVVRHPPPNFRRLGQWLDTAIPST